MKILRIGLRIWLMIASLFSFVAGWIMLVHAPKPYQGASLYGALTQVRPTLEPLPPLSNFGGGDDEQNQFLLNVQPRVRSQSNPFFRTGGS